MSRYHSYLGNAIQIIENYSGKEPFGVHLKSFFSGHKKFGSTDRKKIAIICYDYFRVAAILPAMSMQEKLILAAFLCRSSHSPLLEIMNPDLHARITESVEDKAAYLNVDLQQIFPFQNGLSKKIAPDLYARSFLSQPDFFIRLRPGKEKTALRKLKSTGLPLVEFSDTAVSLPPSTQLANILKPNRDVVIQDFCSQQVLNFIKTNRDRFQFPSPTKVWDACAASGGKSILIHDILDQPLQLTVSDVRDSVLKKLKQRLQQANVPIHAIFQADITNPDFTAPELYDIIIADVPCTGSGTWGRTPEQMQFFLEDSIMDWQSTQKAIAMQAAKSLADKGIFFYITCSVFEAENESVAEFIQSNTQLQCLTQYYITGYDKKADSMFVAVFEKA